MAALRMRSILFALALGGFCTTQALHASESATHGHAPMSLGAPPDQGSDQESTSSDDHSHGDEEISLKPRIESAPAPGTSSHHHAEESAHAKQAHSNDHGAEHAAGVNGETSLKWLMNGNARYLERKYRADGRSAEDRKRLAGGQKPHAIVLSCADSRVPPEIVFDQSLGEIFVIRVAGEALDSSVIASIEYAVEHLGPKLLVVMGHTKCGTVDTAIKVKEGDSAGSDSLDRLLSDIRPRLKTVSTKKPSADLEVESALNADGVARDLVKRSEIVRKKVEAGELLIKPALYRLDSGKVSFY